MGTVPDLSFNRIWTDTRTIHSSDFFVAIRGEHLDGHQFIEDAIKKGVRGFLVDKDCSAQFPNGELVIRVQDTLAALRLIAEKWRNEFSSIPIIAVAGSVGKTTTKDLLASLLSSQFSIAATEMSQNGYLGIPLSILAWERDIEIAIVEIGIDAPGAMEEHLKLVKPTHGILTALGPEHLDGFQSETSAINEEMRLVFALEESEGQFFWNLDDTYLNQTKPHGNVTTFSLEDPTADFVGKISGDELTVSNGIEGICFPQLLPGAHNGRNLLGAITIASSLGVEGGAMVKALDDFQGAPYRSELIELSNGILVFNDSYNANPTSVYAALQTLESNFPDRSKILVLGDMLELGEDEERYHRVLAEQINLINPERVYLYGSRMRWLLEELQCQAAHFTDKSKLAQDLWEKSNSQNVILLKGSRGMRMEEILDEVGYQAAVGK